MTEPLENRERSPQRSPQAKQYRDRSSLSHSLSHNSSCPSTLTKSCTHFTKSHKSPAQTNRTQRGRTLERKVRHDDDDDGDDAEEKGNDIGGGTHGDPNCTDDKNLNPELEIMKLMGFGSFGTTKNKHVAGVGSGSTKKNKKAEYRQYMNREKGFNRALSPERR